MHRLSPLLAPRSIAIVGASARPESLGNTVIKNLLRQEFRGEIFPVHPKEERVLGVRCYKTLKDVPDQIDCVVIALGADKVFPVLEDMKALGIKAAVVFASGFAETGAAGAALQNRLVTFCDQNEISLCGPNCLGLFNTHQGAPLYSAALSDSYKPGNVALVSQSGSACIALSSLQRFDFSYLISLGNGAVTDIADYLDFIAEDEVTRVAALFVESLTDPEKFAAAAEKMHTAGKAVVALKVGRTRSGAAASAAHTGAVATSDDALQAFFRRAGVVLVEDYDELVETCTLFLHCTRKPSGDGVAVLNVSGGELAMTCDIAERTGIRLPALSHETLKSLEDILPDFASARNPLDATGTAVFDTGLYGNCLLALAKDPSISMVAVSQDCPATMGEDQAKVYHGLALAVADMAGKIEKPLVFFNNVAGPVHTEVLSPLIAAGVPVLRGTRNGLRAIHHFIRHHCDRPVEHRGKQLQIERQPVWVERLRQAAPFTERESKAFLADHGVTVTREKLARSADEAISHAAELGYPVVLKIESADLPHKQEVGGVMLNLMNETDVRNGYNALLQRVRTKAPTASLDGVLIQQMISNGTEAIVGVVNHEPFGPGIIVGSGGTLVELLADTAFDLAPVSRAQAEAMIANTKLGMLIKGFRGSAAGDAAALANAVAVVSEIAVSYRHELEAIDLNPVLVRQEGSGAVVLDALIVPKKANNEGFLHDVSNNQARLRRSGGRADIGTARENERTE